MDIVLTCKVNANTRNGQGKDGRQGKMCIRKRECANWGERTVDVRGGGTCFLVSTSDDQ